MSTLPAASGPRKAAHGPLVDSHLVMNALNQLAALQIGPPDPDNPLVFVLSDYLRETLSTLESSALPLAQEIKLMEAHLMLQACVSHTAVELAVTGAQAALAAQATPGSAARGTLSEVVISVFKSVHPRTQAQWTMDVALAPAAHADQAGIQCTISVSTPAGTHPLDTSTVQRELEQLEAVRSARVTLQPGAVIPSATPARLVVVVVMGMQ